MDETATAWAKALTDEDIVTRLRLAAAEPRSYLAAFKNALMAEAANRLEAKVS